MTPDYSGHPKRYLTLVEGAVPGCGGCSEDAEQEEYRRIPKIIYFIIQLTFLTPEEKLKLMGMPVGHWTFTVKCCL